MLSEKHDNLAKYLAQGMTQPQACEKAGYNINSRSAASGIIRHCSKNPEFIAKLNEYKTLLNPPQVIDNNDNSTAGLENYVLTNYKKLINLSLNTVSKDGKLLTFNAGVARQALRDMAEMCNLFNKLDNKANVNSQDLNNIYKDIEQVESKLNNLKIINYNDINSKPLVNNINDKGDN